MSDLEVALPSDTNKYVALSIVSILGLFGLAVNCTAIFVILKSPSLKNCFGYLLLLHAIAEALVMVVMVFWGVPVSLCSVTLQTSTLGNKMGQIIQTFYYATIYAQLMKAINRFVAVFNPVVYRRWFADENVKFIVVATLIPPTIHGSLYFIDGCNAYFTPVNFVWTYMKPSWCADFMQYYIDLLLALLVIGVIMLIDVCTMTMLVKSGIFKKSSTTKSKNGKEIRFFLQAFFTSILYTVMLVIYLVISGFNDSFWFVFCTTTVTWELCHVVDGMSMLAFNYKHRKTKKETSNVRSKTVNPAKLTPVD